ncbi:MAG: OsmC family protein [Gemmatimonadaceae bacterium]|nr:OsmC family protein [Gemmatimonadaceae bacterium]
MSSIATIPGVEVKSANRVHVTWTGGQSFEAGRPGGVTHRIDGDAQAGPSPVDSLLNALAACTSIDVVEILAKRRTPVQTLTVDVEGARAQATPARLVGIHCAFRIAGAGIERVHAERAIELSVTKYCSVRDSLDPNIPINWSLELEG